MKVQKIIRYPLWSILFVTVMGMLISCNPFNPVLAALDKTLSQVENGMTRDDVIASIGKPRYECAAIHESWPQSENRTDYYVVGDLSSSFRILIIKYSPHEDKLAVQDIATGNERWWLPESDPACVETSM